ncbi:MAG: nucleoside-triphosphatase [Candidatus Izemoplasmataceae bacterium]
MINIITGKINSYKTTRIKKIYDEDKLGDGFISVKTMKEDKVLYYEFEHLKTGSKRISIIHTNHYPNQFTKYDQVGPYVFDLDYLKEVEQEIEQMIAQRVEPIFIDEIGLLEINKKYFYTILKKIVDSELEAYITVRNTLITSVIDVLKLKDYKIIG